MDTETKPKTRKKRPPPKRRKHPEAKYDIKNVEETAAKLMEAERTKKLSGAWLRRLAEVIYTTSISAVSATRIHAMSEFKDSVCLDTIRLWSKEDRWLEKRNEHFNRIKEKIKSKIASATVQSRVKQLKMFEDMFLDSLGKLSESEPGTYEGMVGAVIKLTKAMEDLRSNIADEVIPKDKLYTLGEEGPAITPKLTHEEARAAAMAILAQRKANKDVPTDPTDPTYV